MTAAAYSAHRECGGPSGFLATRGALASSHIAFAVSNACVDMYSIAQGRTMFFGHAEWQSWMAAFRHGRQRPIPLTQSPWAMLTLKQPCMRPDKVQAARTDTRQSCRSVQMKLECGHIKHQAMQKLMHAAE